MIALLDSVETIGNSNTRSQLPIVALQIHQRQRQQSCRRSNVQVHIGSLLDTRTLAFVNVVGADHRLRWLHHLPSLDKPDQSFLQLQVSKTFLLASHSQTNHTQRPSCRKRITLSFKTLIAAWSFSDLRQSHFSHGPVARCFVKQAHSNQRTGLHIDGYLYVYRRRQQHGDVQNESLRERFV